MHTTLQHMHKHHKHLLKLPNRNPLQQQMPNPMPYQHVQQHKHLPILPHCMLIMLIFNNLLIMHITLYPIQ